MSGTRNRRSEEIGRRGVMGRPGVETSQLPFDLTVRSVGGLIVGTGPSTSGVHLGTQVEDNIPRSATHALSCYKASDHVLFCRDAPDDHRGHPCRSAGPSRSNTRVSGVSMATLDTISSITPRGPSLGLSAGPSASGRSGVPLIGHGGHRTMLGRVTGLVFVLPKTPPMTKTGLVQRTVRLVKNGVPP